MNAVSINNIIYINNYFLWFRRVYQVYRVGMALQGERL